MTQSSISETESDDRVEQDDAISDAEIVAETDRESVEEVVHETEDRVEDAVLEDGGSSGSSFAGNALRLLILVIVIFGLSLWLVPMAAPYLPHSIAKHVMPGQQELDGRLAALEEKVTARTDTAVEDLDVLKKQIAALTERLQTAEAEAAKAKTEAAEARAAAEASAKAASTASVSEGVVEAAETSARDAAQAADTATTAATEAGKVAASAVRDTASLSRQMTSFESRLGGLREEITALGQGLAASPAGSGGETPELAAAFTALQARVDGLAKELAAGTNYLTQDEADRFATQDDLRSSRTALAADVKAQFDAMPKPDAIVTSDALGSYRKEVEGKLADLSARVETAEKGVQTAADAATAASNASTAAVGQVESAILDASLKSAVAALSSRMGNGLPFAGALDEIVGLTGAEAPEALSAASAGGVATTQQLVRSFGRTAQQAIAADIQASADGEGVLGQAGAQLRSVFAGRPKSEVEGNDAAAIISRVEARLGAGDLGAALTEIEALPEAAKTVMADWIGSLSARVNADAAATDYIATLTGQQG